MVAYFSKYERVVHNRILVSNKSTNMNLTDIDEEEEEEGQSKNADPTNREAANLANAVALPIEVLTHNNSNYILCVARGYF